MKGQLTLPHMRISDNDQKRDFWNRMRVVDQKPDYHLEWPKRKAMGTGCVCQVFNVLIAT